MEEYSKKQQHELHSALGLAAGGLLIYEIAAITGVIPKGGGGGGGVFTTKIYDPAGFVVNTHTDSSVSAAQAWVQATYGASSSNTTFTGSYKVFDSTGALITQGTITPSNVPPAVNLYDTVVYTIPGVQTITKTFSPAQLVDGSVTAFINSLPSGTTYTLNQIWQRADGTQYSVQLSSGRIG